MARKIARPRPPAQETACTPEGLSLRDRIMHAAFSLFMERGYSETSTLAIATRARVSKRDIYALFPHKSDILAVAIAERARRMRQPLDLPAARTRATLARTLAAHGAAVLQELTSPEVAAVYRLAIAEGARSRDLAETLDNAGRQPNEDALTAFLAGVQAARLIGPGDAREMARQFYGLLLGVLQIRLLLRVIEPPDTDAIEARARMAAQGLLALHPPRRGRFRLTPAPTPRR
jgi:AcrR family transcriptional regulator